MLGDPSTFTDVPQARACPAGGGGRPAQVVFLRHCDETYTCPPTKSYNGCPGCEFSKSTPCASNKCSTHGVQRAYGYANWLKCFAKGTSAPIAAIVGQIFVSGKTNQRPMTTASMVYDGLIKSGTDPNTLCWQQYNRVDDNLPDATIIAGYRETLVAGIMNPAFNGKTVVVVWDHHGIDFILAALQGLSLTNYYWPACCYDQAAVFSGGHVDTYRLNAFTGNDPCSGAICQSATSSYNNCSGAPSGPSPPPPPPSKYTPDRGDMFQTGKCLPCAPNTSPYLSLVRGGSSYTYDCYASLGEAQAAGSNARRQDPPPPCGSPAPPAPSNYTADRGDMFSTGKCVPCDPAATKAYLLTVPRGRAPTYHCYGNPSEASAAGSNARRQDPPSCGAAINASAWGNRIPPNNSGASGSRRL